MQYFFAFFSFNFVDITDFFTVVYTIEFQKRGLPHAHILFFGNQRPKIVFQVDAIISAEIPDKTIDPFAYQSIC